MSYSGDMEGCHARARTDNGRTTEHEDSARILEAEFAICRYWSERDSLYCHLPRWDEQIWIKVQRNTYKPWTAISLVETSKYGWQSREILMNPVPTCPKLEDDFVPNWRMIEKRQLRLENQTKTRLSSSQELVFVCLFPMMCATPVVSMHFLREIWLES